MKRPPMTRTDGSNAFAHHTMSQRIPGIIRDIQHNQPDYPPNIHKALNRLHDDLVNDAPIPNLQLPAPDYDDWQPALADHAGHTWLQTDWFFAETYLYRLIIEAVRWWEIGLDPFATIKSEESQSEALWRMLEKALSVEGTLVARLAQHLSFALWGNRLDLSYLASASHGSEDVKQDDLLVDQTPSAIEHLLSYGGTVHIITDNFGTELAMDLALVDILLHTVTDSIVLHVKTYPIFVSDATVQDVMHFLEMLRSADNKASELGKRLSSAMADGKLRLAPDLFWTSSHLLRQMPDRLEKTFVNASLVILKGDVNYRRMVDDAIWPPATTLAEAAGYFPAPLLVLRTLKSDTIVGLPPGLADKLNRLDETWRNNGRRGLIQFKP